MQDLRAIANLYKYFYLEACVREDLAFRLIPVEGFCIFKREDPLDWLSFYPKLLRALALLIVR